jgi:ubiquinone/menaquinone biosynthesis C-methylase UbiE
MENKNHWYDGLFYDKLIAPNQDRMFGKIKDLIDPGSEILDVGCGTGRLEFFLSDKCRRITGIDLSEKNIKQAEKNLKNKKFNNISFKHTGFDSFIKKNSVTYDHAVMTYVIHEMPYEDRLSLLRGISRISKKIIVGDYLVPRPKGFWNVLNEIVEFTAGKDHYNNFKSFVRHNGVMGLLNETGLKVHKEIKNDPVTSHILVLT